MKILKSILLIYIISCNFLLAQYGTFGGGDGTEYNPYQIYSKAHLEELSIVILNSVEYGTSNNFSVGKYFILMNDITDSVRIVIGTSKIYNLENYPDVFYSGSSFQGNFDGQGHKITLALNPHNLASPYSYVSALIGPGIVPYLVLLLVM